MVENVDLLVMVCIVVNLDEDNFYYEVFRNLMV